MSAIFQKQLNKSYLDMYDGVDTSQSSFKENMSVGAIDQITRGNSNSRARMLEDSWQPFLDEIKNKTGQDFFNPARHLNKGIFGASATHGANQWNYRHDSKKIFEFIKANEQSLGPEFMTLNHDFIIDRAIKKAQHHAEQFDEVVERSGDWKNFLGRLAGAIAGSFDDPVIQDTMVGGYFFAPIKSIWSLAFREAVIGGSSEALIQASVQEWYKELELPYTWETFALNVAAASTLSAAFPLTFRIGGEVVKLSGSQAKKGYEAIKNAHKSIGQEVSENARTAENIADEIESTIGTSPINDVDEHLDRVDAHADAIDNGEAPTVTNEPTSGPTAAELENVANPGKFSKDLDEVNQNIAETEEAIKVFKDAYDDEVNQIMADFDKQNKSIEEGGILDYSDPLMDSQKQTKLMEDTAAKLENLESKKNLEDAGNLMDMLLKKQRGIKEAILAQPEAKPRATINDVVSRFEVDELNVDAKAFQFKEGGDEFGVTERLKDVKTWDPVKAGTVVVYEQADGKLFIADGHQRLGLAKRIKSQDPKQDVFLLGSVLREKDGISRDQAMVVAAMKNIAEGTGTVLDAVKVLRGDQKLFKELPPRSALVRMARNIVNINDDEAFGLFKNGLVSPQQAAVVGRMIPEDATMQRAAMNVLAKAKPENDVQAESIVRQVMDSGTEKVNQESLFGNALEEESLYFERAKVLDNAVKILQRDKSAFNTIVKNQTKFESEGNQLARSANEQKIQKDGQAIQLIQTLANRRGQLSDDLTAAARVAKQSGQYNKATDSFVQSVRGAVDRGDFNGEILGDPGRTIDAPPQNGTIPTRAVEKSLDDFDDPAGLGSQKQMDQMEADMFQQPPEVKPREAFQSDDELRNDLGNIIEQGADEAVVDAHPAVTKAIEESMARPETTTLPGYGTDQFRQARSFNTLRLQELGVKLENTITGYTDAIVALYKGARNLAWKDDELDLPVGKYINQDKRAAIVLGPPAAGKSTIANPIARRMNAAIIDSDEAKKILPEYDGGIGANAVHEESSALAERVLNMALELGDNVVIPKVGGTVGSIEKLVNKLKEKGYSVDLVDMSVTYKNARNRMFLRFVKEGRLINPDYVRQVGDNPGKTYDTLKQQGKADGYTRIDNNGQIDKPKDLIEDTSGLTQGSDIRLRRSGGERDPGGELAGSQERGFRGAEEITDGELDLEIPVGQRIDDATNEVTVVNQTMRQIKDEIDYENKMIDRMGYCVK